jgi:hypothetical protein
MVAWRRARGHGPAAYRCGYHHYRGTRACTNGNLAAVTTVTTAVINGLRAQVLAPDILIPAIREAITRYQGTDDRTVERRLQRVRAELETRARHDPMDRRSLKPILPRRVEQWQDLLAGNLDEARQVLRQLLPERARAGGGFEITADAALGGVVAAIVDGPQFLVPPGGLADRYARPLRGLLKAA